MRCILSSINDSITGITIAIVFDQLKSASISGSGFARSNQLLQKPKG